MYKIACKNVWISNGPQISLVLCLMSHSNLTFKANGCRFMVSNTTRCNKKHIRMGDGLELTAIGFHLGHNKVMDSTVF